MKMSKIFAAVSAAVIAVSAIPAFAVSASDKEFDPERDLTGTDYYDYFYDYDPHIAFTGIGWITEDGKFFSSEYMEIWQKQIFDKDFTIENGKNLRIEPIGNSPDTMSGGRLVISGGATVEIIGTVCVERGGVLEIEDGTLYIHGGSLDNYGTVKIGEKGRLVFRNGSLNSTAAGNIENEGKILCLDSEKDMDKIFKTIKKYDKNFNLSDYSLHIFGRGGGEADVILSYCINDVQTNYTYKFTVDRNKEKTQITRKPYDLETVYSKDTEKDILSRTEKFEENYKGKRKRDAGYYKDYGYSYNYKSGKLVYEEVWFTFEDEVGEDGNLLFTAFDHTYSEKL
ncbi:MAG: hypothetical protein K2N60_10390 [Oscillospiraceae bacterium]|nr:hypothetical protein [Oscillospiraceae bacterium]